MTYVHGYSLDEQQRLLEQARFLEPLVFERVDFSGRRKVLEIGCGVGAQSKIVLSKYPHLHLTSVDFSQAQLEAARKNLESEVSASRVSLIQASVYELPFDKEEFDGLFVCWFLEHVPDPLKALIALSQVLKTSSRVHLAEVYNAPLSYFPHSLIIEEYWIEFNRLQRQLGGDPFIGIRLNKLLHEAGYREIETQIHTICLDGVRDSQKIQELKKSQWGAVTARELKNQFLDYWVDTLLSGLSQLIANQVKFSFGQTAIEVEDTIRKEFASLKRDSESIFHFSYATAVATK